MTKIAADIYIDWKMFGEIEVDVELPEETEGESFDKHLHDILKIKILEDEQMKAFVTWILSRETEGQTDESAANAMERFWDERFILKIKI